MSAVDSFKELGIAEGAWVASKGIVVSSSLTSEEPISFLISTG